MDDEVAFRGLSNDERTRMQLMTKEIDAQRASLRLLDGSLHQLAFAYIAAFALCVPAVLTRRNGITISLGMQGIVGFIVCTLFYLGGFYALMLVRSRNNCVGHIAFLQRQINELLECRYGRESRIVFSYSSEIVDFYRGKAHGHLWAGAYIVFLGLVVTGCVYTAYANVCASHLALAVLSIIELVVCVGFWAVYYALSGGLTVQGRIEKEYRSWLVGGKTQGKEAQGEKVRNGKSGAERAKRGKVRDEG